MKIWLSLLLVPDKVERKGLLCSKRYYLFFILLSIGTRSCLVFRHTNCIENRLLISIIKATALTTLTIYIFLYIISRLPMTAHLCRSETALIIWFTHAIAGILLLVLQFGFRLFNYYMTVLLVSLLETCIICRINRRYNYIDITSNIIFGILFFVVTSYCTLGMK